MQESSRNSSALSNNPLPHGLEKLDVDILYSVCETPRNPVKLQAFHPSSGPPSTSILYRTQYLGLSLFLKLLFIFINVLFFFLRLKGTHTMCSHPVVMGLWQVQREPAVRV